MKIFDRDTFIYGLVTGIITPLLGLGLIKGILYILSMTVDEHYNDWRMRTISLIAIVANFIPFQINKGRHNFESMRGITIPTLLFGIAWVIYYREFILGN